MSFQTKNFLTILLGMTNLAKATQDKITDFRVGSVARTLLEASAAEIDELYQNMFIGLKEAIPVAIYNSFEFGLLPAVSASGLVRVTITSSDLVTNIPAGTEFSINASSQRYISLSDAIIPAGNTYIDVAVAASSAGIGGNIPAAQSFSLTPSPAGFLSASNSAEFINGAESETSEQRKSRFVDFVQTLNRGTVSALQYGAKQSKLMDASGSIIEQVNSSVVIEPWLTNPGAPVALVELYIHNGASGASGALIAETSKVIDGYIDGNGARVAGWKSAGVKVNVYAAALTQVNITAFVSITDGFDAAATIASVTAEIANYIDQLPIAGNVLLAEIISSAMGIAGVDNFTIVTPGADVSIGATNKAFAGIIAVTEP